MKKISNNLVDDPAPQTLFKYLKGANAFHYGLGKGLGVFVKTQEENLSKGEYYSLLGKSKAIVSYALQENFGFGVAEAVYLGCKPVLPNRLVYPELYPNTKLFDRFEESVDMVIEALLSTAEFPSQVVSDPNHVFNLWFSRPTTTPKKMYRPDIEEMQ